MPLPALAQPHNHSTKKSTTEEKHVHPVHPNPTVTNDSIRNVAEGLDASTLEVYRAPQYPSPNNPNAHTSRITPYSIAIPAAEHGLKANEHVRVQAKRKMGKEG